MISENRKKFNDSWSKRLTVFDWEKIYIDLEV